MVEEQLVGIRRDSVSTFGWAEDRRRVVDSAREEEGILVGVIHINVLINVERVGVEILVESSPGLDAVLEVSVSSNRIDHRVCHSNISIADDDGRRDFGSIERREEIVRTSVATVGERPFTRSEQDGDHRSIDDDHPI
jgi:hypothetical protein